LRKEFTTNALKRHKETQRIYLSPGSKRQDSFFIKGTLKQSLPFAAALGGAFTPLPHQEAFSEQK
jgi:hypothetical protein